MGPIGPIKRLGAACGTVGDGGKFLKEVLGMRKLFIALLVFSFLASGLWSGETRPVRDDIGFCWQPGQVDRLMAFLEKQETGAVKLPMLVAGVSPHDDYLYAGRVFYPLYRALKAQTPREVVVFGVTHGTVRRAVGDPQAKIILDDFDRWKGPYKDVSISPLRAFLKEKLPKDSFLVDNKAHKLEHSIESLVPFIQYFNRDFKLTPIMVTGMDFQTMERLTSEVAALLAQYIKEKNLIPGKDIIFLMSADANHYGAAFKNTPFGEDAAAHTRGTEYDKKVAHDSFDGKISKKNVQKFTLHLWGKTYRESGQTLWCGKYSIPFGMLTVLKTLEAVSPGKQLAGKVLRYSDTYTEGVLPIKKPGYGITAPFSLKHWVGFVSAGFYLE